MILSLIYFEYFTLFKDGKGLYFDDLADYTILNMDPNGCWKDLSTCSNGLTVCLWFNVISASGSKAIFSSGADISDQHGIYLYVTSPNLMLEMKTLTNLHRITGIPYTNNDWVHFCLTWQSGTPELKAYVNGSNVVGSPTSSGGPFTSATANFVLADRMVNSAPNPSYASIVKVDDFALWDQALPASAISQIFSSY